MKKLVLLFILLSFFRLSYSSERDSLSKTWGPIIEISKLNFPDKIIGNEKVGYFNVGGELNTVEIQKISSSLDVSGKYIFQEKDNETKATYHFEGAEIIDDKLFIFKSITDRSKKSRKIYVYQIDSKTMAETGEGKFISDIPYTASKVWLEKCEIKISPNGKYLSILKTIETDRKDPAIHTAIVCDNNLNTILTKEVKLSTGKDRFKSIQLACNNTGNMHILGLINKHYIPRIGHEEPIDPYFLYIIDATTQNEMEIKIIDEIISDVRFAIKSDGGLQFVGLYSSVSRSFADGVFFMNIDPKTRTVKHISSREFSDEEVLEGVSETRLKKAKEAKEKGIDLESNSFDLKELLLLENGRIMLIGEDYRYSRSMNYDDMRKLGRDYPNVNYYSFDDILLVSIDSSGRFEWIKQIHKRQTSSTAEGNYYLSFTMANINDKLHFIFNDNLENLSQNTLDKIEPYEFESKNSITCMVSVDNNGTLSKKILYSKGELALNMRPDIATQINEKQIIIYCGRDKKIQYGKLTIE